MITAEEQESSAEINAVHDLFCEEMEKLSLDKYNNGDGDGEGEGENDLSARALMQQRGMTEFQMRLAAAVYANDFGCSLDELGVRRKKNRNNRKEKKKRMEAFSLHAPPDPFRHNCTQRQRETERERERERERESGERKGGREGRGRERETHTHTQ